MWGSRTRKISPVFLFLVLAGGAVFADTDDIDIYPKNIITVDIGPAVYKLMVTGLMNRSESDHPAFVFGIATQYERQNSEKTSAAARLEYGLIDMSRDDSKWVMSSIMVEGHGRVYFPPKRIWFLDGILGYANVFADFSTADDEIKSVAHYLKFGGKLGWKTDIGNTGKWVLEVALGGPGQ